MSVNVGGGGVPRKNKNPTLRMWGIGTPHLRCGEHEMKMMMMMMTKDDNDDNDVMHGERRWW